MTEDVTLDGYTDLVTCVSCEETVICDQAKLLGWTLQTWTDGEAVWLCPDCQAKE